MKEIKKVEYYYKCEKCGATYKDKDECKRGESIPVMISNDIKVGDNIEIDDKEHCNYGRPAKVEKISIAPCSERYNFAHREQLLVRFTDPRGWGVCIVQSGQYKKISPYKPNGQK